MAEALAHYPSMVLMAPEKGQIPSPVIQLSLRPGSNLLF